jgi:uncharacterized protein
VTPTTLPHPDELATLVIQHWVRAGLHDEYEQWLGRIMPVSQDYPGHLGANVIRPTGTHQPYTIVVRFDTTAHLENWVGSERRRELVAEIAPLLKAPDQFEVHKGAAFWFTPAVAGGAPPVRWKQAVLTLAVIYPLTLLVPFVLDPLFRAIPLLGESPQRGLIVTMLMVLLVVYLIMPRMTRWLAVWLTR